MVGAKRELDQELKHLVDHSPELNEEMLKRKVQWLLNPPYASHFGGAWERMLRSVRKFLDFLLHLQKLTEELLQTFMCEVEYILNSRPLTPVSADPKDLRPITPNDILLPRATSIPASLVETHESQRKKLWRQAQYLADQFWQRWRSEYVHFLQERPVAQRQQENIRVGDVVVLVDSSVPRGQWLFGLVKSLRTSDDGLVRSATVFTNGKKTTRPISKMVLVVSSKFSS